MTTKTIKTSKGEVLNIAKMGSKSWYGLHAYGMSNKVVFKDENGGMWARMNGEWIEVQYRLYGTYETFTDTTGVTKKPAYVGGRTATDYTA